MFIVETTLTRKHFDQGIPGSPYAHPFGLAMEETRLGTEYIFKVAGGQAMAEWGSRRYLSNLSKRWAEISYRFDTQGAKAFQDWRSETLRLTFLTSWAPNLVNLTVEVRPEDVVGDERGRYVTCPIYRAVRRTFMASDWPHTSELNITKKHALLLCGPLRWEAQLGPAATEFIRQFDALSHQSTTGPSREQVLALLTPALSRWPLTFISRPQLYTPEG